MTSKGSLVWLKTEDLNIDHTYQRASSLEKIEEIEANFDWPLFGCVVVVRRSNGKYFIVDGQHRVVATPPEIVEVPCILFEAKSREEEAKMFVGINRLRKPITAAQTQAALVVAKDEISLWIEKLALVANRKTSSASAPSTVACVSALRKIAKDGGEEAMGLFEELWDIIIKICSGKPISHRLVRAIFYLETHLHEESLLSKKWSSKLAEQSLVDLEDSMKEAKRFLHHGSDRTWAIGIMNRLNRNVREENWLRIVEKGEGKGRRKPLRKFPGILVK